MVAMESHILLGQETFIPPKKLYRKIFGKHSKVPNHILVKIVVSFWRFDKAYEQTSYW